MTVFRLHHHDKGFAAIDNETLRDARLSFRARGVLGYLLSQPPEFSATSEAISGEGTEGREAVRAAMRELETVGYIERERTQGSGGRWETVVHVYERPQPEAQEPVVGATSTNGPNLQVAPRPSKPAAGEPGAKDLRRERLKTEDETLARPRPRDEVWDALEAIFGGAPKHKNLRGAWNVAAKELRDQGATPEEIAIRFARYRADMPNAACTPMALAKHWGRYAEGTPATREVSKFQAARGRRRLA